MEKTIIEGRAVVIICIFFVAALITAGIVILTQFSDTLYALFFFTGAIIWAALAISKARSGKERITADDSGLTLNGEVNIGPIPWDCISGASIRRVVFEKVLYVHLTNISLLEATLGEDAVRKKTERDKKTGGRFIKMDLFLYKLRGIDPAELIRKYAKG